MSQSSISEYCNVLRALEAYDNQTYFDKANENIEADIKDITSDLNPKLNAAAASYSAAMAKKDANAALKAVSDIENIAKEWKIRLSNIPPESTSKVIIRNTCKLAAIMAAACLIIKGGAIANIAKNIILSKTNSKHLAGIGKYITESIVSGAGFGQVIKLVSNIYNKIVLSKSMTSEDKSKYNDDPNRRNFEYLSTQVGLDQWLKAIPRLKAEIKNSCR